LSSQIKDLPNKVRAFGVRQGVELSVTAAVLFALPLAAVVALLGLSAFWVPQGPLQPVPGRQHRFVGISGAHRLTSEN
jgi:hypothetical protein